MKTATPMRAAIYARYSGPEATSTIRRQAEACRRFATEIGATVEREYVDRVAPGSAVVDRVALAQLVGDARRGTFDTVIVESLDRIGRDMHSLAAFENSCGLPVRYANGVGTIQQKDAASGSFLDTVRLPESRLALTMRLMAGRKAKRERLEAAGPATPLPYEGKTPKLGRAFHTAIRNMYQAACQAGADRAEIARALNRVARSVEIARQGAAK